MEVIIRENAAQVYQLASDVLANRIASAPRFVLGCATGRTMDGVYEGLIAKHREGLSFAHCSSFNLDEYVGLASDDPFSYHYYMYHRFFKHVDIPLQKTHLPDGMASDFAAEALAFEHKIAECGGIDVQLLGLGESGHIGFNEPLSSLMSRTREKALSPQTRAQNAALFVGREVPHRAITMGVGTILEAKEILLVVTGESKAPILAQAIEGPVRSLVSATALQLHQNCKVLVDEAAAQLLEGQEYYRWIFDNEPEWQVYQ